MLLDTLDDQRLRYVGSVVLGLNDALVELTGTLAGLTLAFQNTLLIGVTGLVMGVAASLSMAASGYLSSTEEESEERDPLTSAIYTGVAYIGTVLFLVAPYFLFDNVFVELGVMLAATLLIISGYTFYVAVAKWLDFWQRFLRMGAISVEVAIISFAIGWAINRFIEIEV